MSITMRDYNTHISFKWDEDAHEEFQRVLFQLKGEGKVDPSINKSEAFRRLLEDFTENPDPERLER